MAAARLGAGVAAFFKLATGRRTPLINATTHLLSQGASERGTAGGHMVGSAHACGATGDIDRQATGHAPIVRVEFANGEVHPETGATGTTARTACHGFMGFWGQFMCNCTKSLLEMQI